MEAHADENNIFDLVQSLCLYVYDPRQEISNNVVKATSKDSDQPAHTRSLVRAFASRLNIVKLQTEHNLEFLSLLWRLHRLV